MDLTTTLFIVLLAGVGIGRLGEMRLSGQLQRVLESQGAQRVREARFGWMVALHNRRPGGAALEVVP